MAYVDEAWARPPAELVPPGEGSPTGQEQAGEGVPSPGVTGPQLAEVPLTETVESALVAAAAEAGRHGQPIDTKTLLVALMDADPAGRWDRIWLHSRSREAIEQAGYEDPPVAGRQWDNMALTGACARAFETAWRVSQEYRRTPLQLGVLVLGLIADESRPFPRAEHR